MEPVIETKTSVPEMRLSFASFSVTVTVIPSVSPVPTDVLALLTSTVDLAALTASAVKPTVVFPVASPATLAAVTAAVPTVAADLRVNVTTPIAVST